MQFLIYHIQTNHITETAVNLYIYTYIHTHTNISTVYMVPTTIIFLKQNKILLSHLIRTENCILYRFETSFRMSEQRIRGTYNIVSLICENNVTTQNL